VADVLDDLQPGACDPLGVALRVCPRDDAILGGGDHERPRADAPQPALELGFDMNGLQA
jgi:hypothetical protein